ncbi:hypothetical protein SRHO_G00088110 [Serrasalmus rhombeus]
MLERTMQSLQIFTRHGSQHIRDGCAGRRAGASASSSPAWSPPAGRISATSLCGPDLYQIRAIIQPKVNHTTMPYLGQKLTTRSRMYLEQIHTRFISDCNIILTKIWATSGPDILGAGTGGLSGGEMGAPAPTHTEGCRSANMLLTI